MLPLKSKLCILILCATLVYLSGLSKPSTCTVQSRRTTRSPAKRPLRLLGRTSGTRSSTSAASSHFSRRTVSEQRPGTVQHTRAAPQHHSPANPQHNSQPAPPQSSSYPQQSHAVPPPHSYASPEPPPPAHPYPTVHASHPNHATSGQSTIPTQGAVPAGSPPLASGHVPAHAYGPSHAPFGQSTIPSQGAAPGSSPPLTNGQVPAQASGTGSPSFAKTAVSSMIGSAVGSLVGTSVANSLNHRSGGSSEVLPTTSTTTSAPTTASGIADSTQASESSASSTTTSAVVESTLPSTSTEPRTTRPTEQEGKATSPQKPRPPLDSPAGLKLVFPGVGERELQNSQSVHSFGASVKEAVVRSVGVSPGRVELHDVSLFPKSSDYGSPRVVVTLSLLPDENLLPTEPSAVELADEISRQVKLSTSYLSRQLRQALPQLPEEFLQPGVVQAVVFERSRVDDRGANSGSQQLGVGLPFSVSLCLFVWLQETVP